MHYQGQSFELVVPVPDGPFDAAMVAHLEEAFGREHERTYGHRAGPEEPVELVSIQVVGQGLREGSGVPERVMQSRPEGDARAAAPRLFRGHARLDRDADPASAPIWRRSRPGPVIIEEYDATCVVPPGATAELDAGGNIVIELG